MVEVLTRYGPQGSSAPLAVDFAFEILCILPCIG
jgi:hypothetical protein